MKAARLAENNQDVKERRRETQHPIVQKTPRKNISLFGIQREMISLEPSN